MRPSASISLSVSRAPLKGAVLFTFALYSLVSMAGCGTDAPGSGDDGGAAAAGAPAGERLHDLPVFGLERELEIDGRIVRMVSVPWVRLAPGGTMALSQVVDFLIHLFGPDGEILGSVGGPSGGPSEPPFYGGAGWKGDTLWVNDATLSRISLFSPLGERLRTFPPLAGARPQAGDEDSYPAYLSLYPVAVYSGDTLLVVAENAFGGAAPRSLSEGRHLLRISADGWIQTHVLRVPEGEDIFEFRAGERTFNTLVPLHPSPLWAAAPDGELLAVVTTEVEGREGGRWRLQVLDAAGQAMAERVFLFEGETIPRDLLDELVEARLGTLPVGQFRTAAGRALRSRMSPVFPPINGLYIGDDHRIWVRTTKGLDVDSWVVLSPGGDPLGRVVLPGDGQLQAADEGRIWVAELDSIGVPSIVRYGLSEGE